MFLFVFGYYKKEPHITVKRERINLWLPCKALASITITGSASGAFYPMRKEIETKIGGDNE